MELASLIEGVGIRDSKAPQVGHLALAAASFNTLLTWIEAGRLDL